MAILGSTACLLLSISCTTFKCAFAVYFVINPSLIPFGYFCILVCFLSLCCILCLAVKIMYCQFAEFNWLCPICLFDQLPNSEVSDDDSRQWLLVPHIRVLNALWSLKIHLFLINPSTFNTISVLLLVQSLDITSSLCQITYLPDFWRSFHWLISLIPCSFCVEAFSYISLLYIKEDLIILAISSLSPLFSYSPRY